MVVRHVTVQSSHKGLLLLLATLQPCLPIQAAMFGNPWQNGNLAAPCLAGCYAALLKDCMGADSGQLQLPSPMLNERQGEGLPLLKFNIGSAGFHRLGLRLSKEPLSGCRSRSGCCSF